MSPLKCLNFVFHLEWIKTFFFLLIFLSLILNEFKWQDKMLNLTAINVFAEVVKGASHTRLGCWACLIISQSLPLAWSTTSDSTVLGQLDFAWLLSFLQLKQNFMNHLFIVMKINCTFTFHTTDVFSCFYGTVWTHKAEVNKLDYVVCSYV